MSWSRKVLDLPSLLDSVTDDRPRPRIPTLAVTRALFGLFVSRVGSLNALEQTRLSRFWETWLGHGLPSADSLGRIASRMDPDPLRQVLCELYRRLRGAKALEPTTHGLTALVLDGHESHSSYLQRCPGCLERRIKTRHGYRTQYYHRTVVAMLLTQPWPLLLDLEPFQAGDTEIDAANRLLKRVLANYPRAFDVVLGDALYTEPSIYRLLLDHHKHIVTVLKRNTPDLLDEARRLLQGPAHHVLPRRGGDRLVWDLEGFDVGSPAPCPVRVLRSSECSVVQRQIDRQPETILSEWFWVTTLSQHRAPTEAAVKLAHARWDIENRGFLETACRWHVDHIYRHEPTAIVCFSLISMIAFNVFYFFYFRNLHRSRRAGISPLNLARCIAAEIYGALSQPLKQPRGP